MTLRPANPAITVPIGETPYWMGAVPVPINYWLAPVEIADILDGISPRLLAVEDHWAGLAAELVSTGRREPLLWIGSDSNSRTGEPDYETLRDAAAEDERQASGLDDDALLLFTGGTTGRSKGVRLTHRNVAANGLQLLAPFRAAEDDGPWKRFRGSSWCIATGSPRPRRS